MSWGAPGCLTSPKGTLKPPTRRDFLATIAAGWASAAAGCARHLPLTVAAAPEPPGAGSLAQDAAARGLFFGCSVDGAALGKDEAYRTLVARQAGILSAERAMTWAGLRPSADVFDFSEADALVAFAEAHAIKLHGHCLCWHKSLPPWFVDQASTATARFLLRDHIARVAGRYAGRMHSWNVVNQGINPADGRADGLRSSVWLRLIGDDYIEAAFHAAREADPKALLTYSDCGLTGEDRDSQRKRVAVLVLLRRLKARGVPLDGLEVQSHLTTGARYGAGLQAFLAGVRELRLTLLITELAAYDPGLERDKPARALQTANVYQAFLALMLREPGLAAVLTRGLTAQYAGAGETTENPGPGLLPFDRDCRPTAAFFSLRNALNNREPL